MAELYCQGYEFEWGALYGATQPRRLSLPTYPFSRERYWVAEKEVVAPAMPRAVDGDVDPERVVLAPVWRVGAAARSAGVLPGEGRHLVLLCEVGGDASELAAHLAGARCIEIAASGDVAERYGVYAERLLAEMQELLRAAPGDAALVQVVVPVSGEGQVHAGLSGLLRTARLEHPKLVGQVIAVAPSVSASDLAELLAQSAGSPEDLVVRVEAGIRSVASWEEIARAGGAWSAVEV